MPRINDKNQRDNRKKNAVDRTLTSLERSKEQQIAALDARLGAGMGATKERARLAKFA